VYFCGRASERTKFLFCLPRSLLSQTFCLVDIFVFEGFFVFSPLCSRLLLDLLALYFFSLTDGLLKRLLDGGITHLLPASLSERDLLAFGTVNPSENHLHMRFRRTGHLESLQVSPRGGVFCLPNQLSPPIEPFYFRRRAVLAGERPYELDVSPQRVRGVSFVHSSNESPSLGVDVHFSRLPFFLAITLSLGLGLCPR